MLLELYGEEVIYYRTEDKAVSWLYLYMDVYHSLSFLWVQIVQNLGFFHLSFYLMNFSFLLAPLAYSVQKNVCKTKTFIIVLCPEHTHALSGQSACIVYLTVEL